MNNPENDIGWGKWTLPLLFIFFSSVIILPQIKISNYEKYSLEEGLSQANVRCILQDRTGFLWFGTQDGLNRFDGYEFVKFKWEPNDTNTISANLISCLAEDYDGDIWIGTLGGICIYNPKQNKFKRIAIESSGTSNIINQSVSSILIASDSTIWIGYYSGGLDRYAKRNRKISKLKTAVNDLNLFISKYVTSLCEDEKGNLWIGTFNGGLNFYDVKNHKCKKFVFDADGKKLSSNIISSLLSDKHGKLFIGTVNGLNIFDYHKNKLTIHKSEKRNENTLCDNVIQCLYMDRKGIIWIGTENNGLNIFEPGDEKFTRIEVSSKESAEVSKNIWSICEDKTGIMWIGTSTSGTIKFNTAKSKFSIINDKSEKIKLSNTSIRSILKDRDGDLWIGTDDGLNRIIKGEKGIRVYRNNNNELSISDNKVWAISEDDKGDIWLGTQRGLAVYYKKKNQFERYIYSFGSDEKNPVFSIRSLFIDTDDLTWLGTYGAGLFSFNRKTKQFMNHTFNSNNKEADKDVVILQIQKDRNGLLWLCCASGMASYNPKTKEYNRYFADQSNLINQIQPIFYTMFEDSDKLFWLGTLGSGMIRYEYKENRFKTITEKEGLANNVVYSILPDAKNNLWLSTNNGISRYNKDSGEIKNFDVSDGLPSNEFNTGAFFIDKQKRIYVGSINGLVHFSPDSIITNNSIPPLVITKFSEYDKEISPNKFYTNGEKIELSADQNYFSFEFSALDYNSPIKNKYAYMLKGYDDSWIYCGTRRYASYTNLDPGEYTLNIKGSNNDGVWNEAGISIPIIINPKFWQTVWFKMLAFGLILGTVIFNVNKRIKRLRKEKHDQQKFSKQMIESQERERMRIASELHDSIGQNLIVIKNRAQLGLMNANVENRKVQLEEISSICSQTISEVREISYNLRPYQLGKLGLTKAVEATIQKAITSTDIIFNAHVDNINETLSPESEIHFYRIIQECLNNAIKHSRAKEVILRIEKEEKNIRIGYNDDGIGFDYMGEMSNKSGMGLTGISERVNLLAGNIKFESGHGKGVAIEILIPVKE